MDPQRKYTPESNDSIRPRFGLISGGGESTPERANLEAIDGGGGENQTAMELSGQESRAQLEVIDGGGESTPERANLMSADEINDSEKQGSPLTSTPFTSKIEPKDIAKKVSNLRKFAPTIGISGLIIGVVAGLSMLLSPSMLFIHLKETLVDRFNIQSAALDTRANKILAKKMGSMTTSCSKLTYACKMTKLNKPMLDKMTKEGIIPVDKSGKPIEIKSDFGSDRPAGYKIKDMATGSLSDIYDAKGIQKLISDDPAIAGRFRNVFDVQWSAFWDETFSGFMSRLGLKRSSMLKGTTQDEITKSYDAEADGTTKTTEITANDKTNSDPNATDAQKAAASKEGSIASTEINDTISSVAKEGDAAAEVVAKDLTKKVGKSGGPLLLASLYCGGTEFASAIGEATRAAQIVQGVAVVYTFIQIADEIKSGNADQSALAAKVALLGGMLTNVMKDSSGKTVKKSAMDAPAMGYLLRGDKPSITSTSDYTKYIPGAGWASTLKSFSQKAAPGPANEACAAFNSPAGQVGQLFADLNPVSIGIFIGTTVFAQQIAELIQPLISGLVKSLAGKLVSSTTVAEDLGNALGTLLPTFMSESANAGGSLAAPANSAGVTEYLALNNDVRLADARIDRATKSPFDATSPNTALGSIVNTLLPYSSSFTSLSSGITSFQSIVSSTVSNIISPATHAAGSDLVGDCPDPSLKVATGPVCNIIYITPVDALKNIDPSDVITHLSSQIDESSGDPLPDSDLKKWIDTCTTGSGTTAYKTECQLTQDDIDSGKAGKAVTDKVYMMLYYLDHRIQRNMDGEDPLNGNAVDTADITGIASGAIAGKGAAIGDYKPGFYQCAEWIGQHVLPDIYGIPNPGGNGNQVAPNLGSKGYTVDHTPAVHSIVSYPAYCTGCGHGSTQYGHVAIVDAVNTDGSIDIEDYNGNGREQYTTSHVPASVVPRLVYAHVEAKFNTGPVKIATSG